MRNQVRVGFTAMCMTTWLLVAATPLSAEVDRLAISRDFFELPRAAVFVADVPQPPKPKGKTELAETLGAVMTEELKAAIKRALPDSRVAGQQEASSDEGGLLLSARFSKLVPGSRAKRFWVGFGAGKAVLELTGDLKERTTGRIVARFVHARASWCCGYADNDSEIRSNLGLIAADVATIVAGALDADQSHDWLPGEEAGAASPAARDVGQPSRLKIDAAQPNAEVEVNGKYVGSTPLEIQLRAGAHQVVVRKAGFQAWRREITLVAGGSQAIWAELSSE